MVGRFCCHNLKIVITLKLFVLVSFLIFINKDCLYLTMSIETPDRYKMKLDLHGLMKEMLVQNVECFLHKYPMISSPSDLIECVDDFRQHKFSDCLSTYDQDLLHYFVPYVFQHFLEFDEIRVSDISLYLSRMELVMSGIQQHTWRKTFACFSVDISDLDILSEHNVSNFSDLLYRYQVTHLKNEIRASVSKKCLGVCDALVGFAQEKMFLGNFDGNYHQIFHGFMVSDFITWCIGNNTIAITIPVPQMTPSLNGVVPSNNPPENQPPMNNPLDLPNNDDNVTQERAEKKLKPSPTSK